MNDINIESLYSVEPVEFENITKALLIKMGFNATTTKASGDGGVDIIAINEQPIIGGKYIIQCKRYALGNNIGEPVVRELYGVIHAENANKGILITTSDFSKQAVAFAKDKAIELINGHDLGNLCNKYLTDVENNSLFISHNHIESSKNRVQQVLSDFELSIERENIGTTKQSLDLVAYARLTNPGSTFRNDLINIFDYVQKLHGIFDDINTRVKTCNINTEDEIRAFFVANMEVAIESPEKKAIFSLVDDYCNKTFKFYHTLVSIAPPKTAISIHNFYIDFVKQHLKLFTIMREYLKSTNDLDKLLYMQFMIECWVHGYAQATQFVPTMSAFIEQAENEIQKSSKGSCFVATIVYGDPFSPEVIVLRTWRDNYLSKKIIGRQFIKFYYAIGPIIADCINDSLLLKRIIRLVLDRFVFVLRERGIK
jgi:hypothetical protein